MPKGMGNVSDHIVEYVIGIVIVAVVVGALGGTLLNAITWISGNMSGFGLGALFSVSLLGILFSVFLFVKIKDMLTGGKKKY